MRSTLSTLATATLSLTWATCEAFHVPAPCKPQGGASARSRRVGRVRMVDASAAASSIAGGEGVEKGTLGSYPGPVIPRVGGAMPEQRPGWFRVPAPGGKHTKVCARCPSMLSRVCSYLFAYTELYSCTRSRAMIRIPLYLVFVNCTTVV